MFEIPTGPEFWPAKNFEPLVVGICFPFLTIYPWQLRGAPRRRAAYRKLLEVSKTDDLDYSTLLCELFLLRRKLEGLPRDMVSRMLYLGEGRNVPHSST